MEVAPRRVAWPERTYLIVCVILISAAGVLLQQSAPGGWIVLTAGAVGLTCFERFRRKLRRRRVRSWSRELREARVDAYRFAKGLLDLIYGLSDDRDEVIRVVEIETRVTRRELDGASDSWVIRLFLNATEDLYAVIPQAETLNNAELSARQPELIGNSIKAMLAWSVAEDRGLLDQEPPILLPGYRFAPGGIS